MNKKDVSNKLPIYKLTSREKVLEYYDKWTYKSQFNQDMIDWQYTAPKNSVNLFTKYALDKDIQILDAGCGSGLVGIELSKKGYLNIFGVDFSQSMLNLVPKGIYSSLKLMDLNLPLHFEDNFFDAIICVGTFTYGHVKANALNEFIRVTKNKGLICFTINEGIYEEYGFNKKIKKLAENKSWNIKKLFKSDYLISKNVKAWLCVAEAI